MEQIPFGLRLGHNIDALLLVTSLLFREEVSYEASFIGNRGCPFSSR